MFDSLNCNLIEIIHPTKNESLE